MPTAFTNTGDGDGDLVQVADATGKPAPRPLGRESEAQLMARLKSSRLDKSDERIEPGARPYESLDDGLLRQAQSGDRVSDRDDPHEPDRDRIEPTRTLRRIDR